MSEKRQDGDKVCLYYSIRSRLGDFAGTAFPNRGGLNLTILA